MAESDPSDQDQLRKQEDQREADNDLVVEEFNNYLLNLCAPLLNTHKQLISKATADPDAKDLIQSFVIDDTATALIVQKISEKGEDPDNAFLPVDGKIVIATDPKVLVGFEDENSSCIVFVKRNEGSLQKTQSISSQVLMTQVHPNDPLSSMLPQVRHFFSPFAKMKAEKEENPEEYQKNRRRGGGVLTRISKLMKDLEIRLLESQQNIQLPTVTLNVDTKLEQWLAGLDHELRDQYMAGNLLNFPPELSSNEAIQQYKLQTEEWKKNIMNVMNQANAKLQIRSESVQQEITIWNKKDGAVKNIASELNKPGVICTINLLKATGNLVVAQAFQADTSVDTHKHEVKMHLGVLKLFPIDKLLKAESVAEIKIAIKEIFEHLYRANRDQPEYPQDRTTQLVEAVARDVANQIRQVLSKDVLEIEYTEFNRRTKDTEACFTQFNQSHDNFFSHHFFNKFLYQRNKTTVSIDILKELHKRIEDIKTLRENHETLQAIIEETFSTQKAIQQRTLEDIERAFLVFKNVDALSVSNQEWKQKHDRYSKVIDEVEMEIKGKIREELEMSRKDRRDMFRVCAKYNKMFTRPHIRAAVLEYKEPLLATVQQEVKLLQDRGFQSYQRSEAHRLSQLRDIPPVAGEIIWANQINAQLDRLTGRTISVLGPNWKSNVDGKDLAESIRAFREEMNTEEIFKRWLLDVQKLKHFNQDQPIFRIDTGLKSKMVALNVNFDEKYVQLFKEVRYLTQLNLRVPLAIKFSCIEVKPKYPFSVHLKEAISVYSRTCRELARLNHRYDRNKQKNAEKQKKMTTEVYLLVDDYKAKCQSILTDGSKYRWTMNERFLNEYVTSLKEATTNFQDKLDQACELTDTIDKCLDELQKCNLDRATLSVQMEIIKKTVEKLRNTGFSMLQTWVDALDKRLEAVLIKRVEEMVKYFSLSLQLTDEDVKAIQQEQDEDEDKKKALFYLRKQSVRFEISVKNQRLHVSPPLAKARVILNTDLQGWLSCICEIPRCKQFLGNSDGGEDFGYILKTIEPSVLIEAYTQIENLMKRTQSYVDEWLNYQALWDMEMSTLFEDLGDDIGKWRGMILDMKKAQETFDNPEVEKKFGPLIIDYKSVQYQVNNKYFAFRRETYEHLRHKLRNLLGQLHTNAQEGKAELEKTSFQGATISKLLDSIKKLRDLRERSADWKTNMEEYQKAEALVKHWCKVNRYDLTDWTHSGQVNSALQMFFVILDRRWKTLKVESQTIYVKLEKEFQLLKERVEKTEMDWNIRRPTSAWASSWRLDRMMDWFKRSNDKMFAKHANTVRHGDLDGKHLFSVMKLGKTGGANGEVEAVNGLIAKLSLDDVDHAKQLYAALKEEIWDHTDVSTRLASFEKVMQDIEVQFDDIRSAKQAMSLVLELGENRDEIQVNRRIQNMIMELKGLQEVHAVLTDRIKELDAVRMQNFSKLDTKDLAKKLRAMQQELTKLPPKFRTYEAFSSFDERLQDYKKTNKMFDEFLSGVLRPKHQRRMREELELPRPWNQLTVGDMFDARLARFQTQIQGILMTARGELALEEFLKGLEAEWGNTKFDMVDYKQTCWLVRNWNDLIADVADRLSEIMSMKQSPFFKAFEYNANIWEEKLNSAQSIFDLWIDVQRRWVYLQGVFTNSADVQRQLSYQYDKFQRFNKQFVQLMRGCNSDPLVDYWIGPDKNLFQTMESHLNTLNGIQKALGEYLESQRAAFSRFYFVGDEDLLEIIGNAKEPRKINRHLAKMFAGLNEIIFEGDSDRIIGMRSKEGETVDFIEPVDVEKNPSIQDWLSMVEFQMRQSLAVLLEEAVNKKESLASQEEYIEWIGRYPAQVCLLATQVSWSQNVEKHLAGLQQGKSTFADMEKYLDSIKESLTLLAKSVLRDIPADLRQKYEQLITEMVYQRNMTRTLIEKRITHPEDFTWLYRMRFYFNYAEKDVLKKLEIRISRAKFYYGFEYLGVAEKLVQTPLTDKAYLTLCEALHARMGGNPFGPAGTGKTESVKSLGAQLGRFVLVFNCDETFDFNAMGRIFVGLCQTGGWGCFDEFNRLEERILSAVSQQILTIQTGLREDSTEIELLNKKVRLQNTMGIFVTMNPGYAGRSELPDNLKQLFRGMAMIVPNRALIGQVMLFSQGFASAEALSKKIVLLFQLCKDQLSDQSHYGFGLRALKSVLRSAGNIKRQAQLELAESSGDETIALPISEEENILIRSLMSTVVPKLVNEDKFLFESLLESAFPGSDVKSIQMDRLKDCIRDIAKKKHFICDDGGEWLEKLLQLYVIQTIQHGVMLVGPSGGGKSAARDVLLEAMELMDGQKSVQYVIDPKAISKDELYGVLDPTTLEWTDGVFTHILRSIIDNVRGESEKRHWIVFDGDVDPEWAENLNSVLDDNKMLTLPNGERLALTPNIRMIFEVPNLDYATQATVSRCGMVWFSHGIIKLDMLFYHELAMLQHEPIRPDGLGEVRQYYSNWEKIQKNAVDTLRPILDDQDSFIWRSIRWVETRQHVMKFKHLRAVKTLFSQLRGGVREILEENESHALGPNEQSSFLKKFLVAATVWSFAGPMKLAIREEFCLELADWVSMGGSNIDIPDGRSRGTLIDYEVRIEDQSFHHWDERVTNIEITHQQVVNPNFVISTLDTLRHEYFISHWLKDQKLVILCGPPGSGKSMTLAAVLRANPQYEMVTLNFSSTAAPDLVFACFDQYCKITRRGNQGYVMAPVMQKKILVVFCDEINLPSPDEYGTMTIITFLRQIQEFGGYWRAEDKQFVSLERIQFVGACNPPTDPGRNILSPRFLNHCPLILVDFPGRESLKQIYGTFNRGLLKMVPSLTGYWEPLTDAMLDVYDHQQKTFTADQQPHYVYSPRELSRWTRGLYRAFEEHLEPELYTIDDLVRLWAHEALRLFHDRLVSEREREYTSHNIDQIARERFPNAELEIALKRPILFSTWLTKSYESVNDQKLREHIQNRLKMFQEEELDVELVMYDEALDHILRIDRVLRQPLGHLLLVGASGAGKTVLSRFVAWMNSMKTFQIKVHRGYTAEDFDTDLRQVLIRSGVEREKIAFIFDESNVLDTAFLERMNALLASGEVPGLFEDADYLQLIAELKKVATRDGLIVDSEEELYQQFTTEVQKNLHIVFTMNPAGDDFKDRGSTSPALFNRCVINWFGTWPEAALFQVARVFTDKLDLAAGNPKYAPDEDDEEGGSAIHRLVSRSIVEFHQAVDIVMKHLGRQMVKSNYVTPRHYLDLINHFCKLFEEKRTEIEELQSHLNMGLKILKETNEEVAQREQRLSVKRAQLEELQVETEKSLTNMLQAEKAAKKEKEESERLQIEVAEQMEQIEERTGIVEGELAEAGPALEKARDAVKGIKRKQLEEIRAFANPPVPVALTLQAVAILLGHKEKKAKNWRDVRAIMAGGSFIKSILDFDTDNITKKMRKIVERDYLSHDKFTYETVNRSSKACGPLVIWARAQMKYSDLLAKVDPLRQEIKDLESNAQLKKEEAEALSVKVAELEDQIAEYKREYSQLMQKQTELKNEMGGVQQSISRAKQLITNLSGEHERWEEQSNDFATQIATVVGDCLLAAGFLTYLGFYNHTYRSVLMGRWREILMEFKIDFNETLPIVTYLSDPTERLQWKQARLPEDDLCVENAIILNRFNRYPLLVDPAGQGSQFLLANPRENKIVRTSFLDAGFLKNLESSMRFGNALLIDDVESLDPILNPVLNREIQKVGGRQLVRLADKDIDFNPLFSIYLCTRDPFFDFTPDLCSRVTFVNFAMTPASLQSQCLSKILRAEAPAVDKTRTDQLKLKGEFKVRLRQLEDQLLDALNSIAGNILDDENVMTTLETLKSEAAEIKIMAAKTDEALEEVNETTNLYQPFAKACSKLFFSLDKMSKVHFLYQFSLTQFLDIVDNILKHADDLPEIEALPDGMQKDREARLEPLLKALCRVTYHRTIRSLQSEDSIAFGLRIAQIFLDCHTDSDVEINTEQLNFFLKGKAFDKPVTVDEDLAGDLELSQLRKQLLENLYAVQGFDDLDRIVSGNIGDWKSYVSGADIPAPDWDGTGNAKTDWEQTLEDMCLNKVFRPDKIIPLSRQFLEKVFGWNLNALEGNPDSLHEIVMNQTTANTPLVFASTPGNDPSINIDNLAAEHFGAQVHKSYNSFAMGSPEGYALAEVAVTKAAKRGTWICLKNVHLSTEWLTKLEKKLHRMELTPAFRLFLTMEINPRVSKTLLRRSNVLIYEPPLGVKASLTRTYNTIPSSRVNKMPMERSRLYVLLAWLHAVILERLRFEPVGWTKKYEFSETDLRCACDGVDEWIDKISRGRHNIDPEDIPWDALHAMLIQYVYGGRVDNSFDTNCLESFVRYLFSSESFNKQFPLAEYCLPAQNQLNVGRLCYAIPSSTGDEKSFPAKIAEISESGDEVRVIFLDEYVIVGEQRIRLRSEWLPLAKCSLQQFELKPLIVVPESTKFHDIKKWISEIPDAEVSKPTVLGLAPRAELMLLERRSIKATIDLLKLQDIAGDEDNDELQAIFENIQGDDEDGGGMGTAPKWMKMVANTADHWIQDLPEDGVTKLPQTAESMKNPMYRFFRREYGMAYMLYDKIMNDLADVKETVHGEATASNYIRQLIQDLFKEAVPKSWSVYKVDDISLSVWFHDLGSRLKQLNKMVDIDYVNTPHQNTIWLGGLFQPSGFIAATRQYVAQQNKWALEDLILFVDIGKDEMTDASFVYSGLTLFGCGWDAESGCLILSEKTSTPLPPSRFRWVLRQKVDDEKSDSINLYSIPVYLNKSMKNLVQSASVYVPKAIPTSVWNQRAVSITVWTD